MMKSAAGHAGRKCLQTLTHPQIPVLIDLHRDNLHGKSSPIETVQFNNFQLSYQYITIIINQFQNILITLKISLCHLQLILTPIPSPRYSTELFSVPINVPFLTFHVNKITNFVQYSAAPSCIQHVFEAHPQYNWY